MGRIGLPVSVACKRRIQHRIWWASSRRLLSKSQIASFVVTKPQVRGLWVGRNRHCSTVS